MTEFLVGSMLAMIVLPPFVYCCVRAATIGYLRAKRTFEKENRSGHES